jgi:hypothetical protein
MWSGHSCPLLLTFLDSLTKSTKTVAHEREGHDFSFKPALSERSEPKGAVKPR